MATYNKPPSQGIGTVSVSPGYANLQATAQNNYNSMFKPNNGNPNGVYNNPGDKGPSAMKPPLTSNKPFIPADPLLQSGNSWAPMGAPTPQQQAGTSPNSFDMNSLMQMLMGMMGGQNGSTGAAPVNYGGQNPSLGRYVPPMMEGRGSNANPNNWLNSGGYAYNVPNSYGVATGSGMGSFLYPPLWG